MDWKIDIFEKRIMRLKKRSIDIKDDKKDRKIDENRKVEKWNEIDNERINKGNGKIGRS